MSVLVVGASGQLGQDLMRLFGAEAAGLTHQDLDVTDGVAVAAAVRDAKPDWVINTSAFHRVDDCELNPALSFGVNAVGAGNVARVAAEAGAGVVFFSTDYVFGGEARERGRPHVEGDLPDPLNVYGVSKWAGEQLTAQGNPRHLVVRSAGLYGTATSRKGWTFPELMVNKARSEGKLRVVTDQALSPTYTADLAAAVRGLMERDAVGLFHLVNDGECSWHEFASATVELAGIDVEVEPTVSTQQARRARRPPYSAMTSERLAAAGVPPLRPWREALADYLRAKGLAA
ncbi:MAG: dTDP-4-dehydrorhamnose reductase [Chloroflexota bacterium]|nr:dTDP-4-dehydrorhamnose reductase [Chloroflexota bacterium]